MIDTRTISRLAPHADALQVREAFISFMNSRSARQTLRDVSDQEAWNAFAKAGFITLPPTRCAECHGRRFSVTARNYARSGSPICAVCRGTGRTGSTRIHVRLWT